MLKQFLILLIRFNFCSFFFQLQLFCIRKVACFDKDFPKENQDKKN